MTEREAFEAWRKSLRNDPATFAPYLVVEESDSAAWLLVGVYPSCEIAKAAVYLTTDRSHGGRPYTWLRIVQYSGEDSLGEWRFDVDTQTWIEVTS